MCRANSSSWLYLWDIPSGITQMLSMFLNIRGKMIKAALNLYIPILKWIDWTPFEINQYVIRAVTKIIHELE